jgi:ribosomal protein S18 acetylase RimI-like enzyme
MLIRDYQASDYPAVLELWESLDMKPTERGDSNQVIQDTLKKGGKLLILEDVKNGRIIGTSWMTNDARRIYLHHFGINKKFQRKGLGKKLAKATLEFIQSTGMPVKLEVHKDNIAAKKLYENLGFFAFTEYDIYMIRDFEE